MVTAWTEPLAAFTLVITGCFVIWNGWQILLGLVSIAFIAHYVRTRTRRHLALSSVLDGIALREYAYELDGSAAGRQTPVTNENRERGQQTIRTTVEAIAEFYGYQP